jgi:hypothetical protein
VIATGVIDMTMTPQVAANRIMREICESEIDLDRALAKSAALLASVVQARVDTGSGFADGQGAIMRLMKTLESMTVARANLARGHGELRRIGAERSDLVFPHESLNSLEAIDQAIAEQIAA